MKATEYAGFKRVLSPVPGSFHQGVSYDCRIPKTESPGRGVQGKALGWILDNDFPKLVGRVSDVRLARPIVRQPRLAETTQANESAKTEIGRDDHCH